MPKIVSKEVATAAVTASKRATPRSPSSVIPAIGFRVGTAVMSDATAAQEGMVVRGSRESRDLFLLWLSKAVRVVVVILQEKMALRGTVYSPGVIRFPSSP